MSIKKTIKEDLKEAMRAHNEISKNTLKGVLSAFVNELVAQGRKPSDELKEEEIIKVIKKQEKQRKDALEKYNIGGRADLAENEEKEIQVLRKYLPRQMAEEKILEIAKRKKEELNLKESSKMGILIGMVMKECAGQADGSNVQKVVQSLFD